jgi:hypothetical protein
MSPRTAPSLCDGVVVPSPELSLQWGCHSGGGGDITCRSPKEQKIAYPLMKYEMTGMSLSGSLFFMEQICSTIYV